MAAALDPSAADKQLFDELDSLRADVTHALDQVDELKRRVMTAPAAAAQTTPEASRAWVFGGAALVLAIVVWWVTRRHHANSR